MNKLKPFSHDYYQTIRTLKKQFGAKAPEVCIVTGTAGPYFKGKEIPYTELGEYPKSIFGNMISGHEGVAKMLKLGGKRVLNLSGRNHFFQGYSSEDIVFLVRSIALWGTKNFILTNASGGLKSYFTPGKIVNITDHISFLMPNPMIGISDGRFGTQFTDMGNAYNLSPMIHQGMIDSALSEKNFCTTGVYVAVQGPTFESPSEAKMLASWGADIVGMSTIPEVLALRAMGCNVGALSLVTNTTYATANTPTLHEENLKITKEAAPKLKKIIEKSIGWVSHV